MYLSQNKRETNRRTQASSIPAPMQENLPNPRKELAGKVPTVVPDVAANDHAQSMTPQSLDVIPINRKYDAPQHSNLCRRCFTHRALTSCVRVSDLMLCDGLLTSHRVLTAGLLRPGHAKGGAKGDLAVEKCTRSGDRLQRGSDRERNLHLLQQNVHSGELADFCVRL
jgi:hypothetical protein